MPIVTESRAPALRSSVPPSAEEPLDRSAVQVRRDRLILEDRDQPREEEQHVGIDVEHRVEADV